MSDHKAVALLELPLEIRHTIFEHVAARDIKSKKLLRKWFEEKEVKELIAKETAANPNGPAPRVVQARDYDDESDVAEQEDEDDGEDEEEAGDEENEDGDGEEDEDEGDDDELEADQVEEDEAEDSDDEQQETGDSDPAVTIPAMNASTQTQEVAAPQATISVMTETQITEDDVEITDAEDAQDEAELIDDQHNDVMIVDDDEAEEQDEVAARDENEDDEGEQAAPPPQAVAVQASLKWRHIPKFMRITRCPPPTPLLLVSKQLHNEAKSWFYDVAVLRIEATGSFAHTSFFEEAFSQITDAAFSPMENIRKVEIMFVWDTTWIRSDTTGCVQAIFPALLRQRADFVQQILSRAPDLDEVKVHWHDSAQDDESMGLMIDVLAPFHTLAAKVEVVEHYIAADAKPHKRSIAGKRRVEFQGIADMGLDRLF